MKNVMSIDMEEISRLGSAIMDGARLTALLAMHTDDSDLPEKSSFHRVVAGDFGDVFGPVSNIHGHDTRLWREFVKGIDYPSDVGTDDMPDDIRLWVSARNWVAITQILEDRQRIRIFDDLDSPVAVVTCVTEGASFHSVRPLIAVEDVKRQWERNPTWSLADATGFGGHERELALHSSEWVDRRETERLQERQKRIDAIVAANGLDPRVLVEKLLDIEDRVTALSRRLDEEERCR